MANYTWLKTSTFRLVSIFQGYPEILRITGEYFKHILKCQESKNVKNILYYSILFLHHYVWMKRTQKVKNFYLRSCHLEQIDWSIRRRWLKKRKKKNVKPLGWWDLVNHSDVIQFCFCLNMAFTFIIAVAEFFQSIYLEHLIWKYFR